MTPWSVPSNGPMSPRERSHVNPPNPTPLCQTLSPNAVPVLPTWLTLASEASRLCFHLQTLSPHPCRTRNPLSLSLYFLQRTLPSNVLPCYWLTLLCLSFPSNNVSSTLGFVLVWFFCFLICWLIYPLLLGQILANGRFSKCFLDKGVNSLFY